MNRSVLNRTLLNTSVLCQSRLNQSGLASQRGKAGGIPAAIRQAMVLWYDIARQGCTNETMQENPVLRDLSGNGHDATCYNFGWTEGSGISTEEYPGALVSDGVDDYAYVEGLPILTKEKGYTVVAKRKWLDEDGGDSSSLASKTTTGSGNDGAFMFEYKEGGGKLKKTKSFGGTISLDDAGFAEGDVVYQTSTSYNGEVLNSGSYADTDKMVLCRFSTSIDSYYNQFALYSLLLFSRDLTAEEIEWVKTNLITA